MTSKVTPTLLGSDMKNHTKKIEKYVSRDKVTQNKDIYKILNDRKQKEKEDRAKELIWKFDKNYDPNPVLKWFEYEDGQVAKISTAS